MLKNVFSIRFRLVVLGVGVSAILLVMLGIIVPLQTKKLSSDIMKENATFITNLLSENLALGMQTLIIDDGETLKKSISMLESKEKESLISDISIFDNNGKFIQSMSLDTNNLSYRNVQNLTIKDQPKTIVAYAPMFDQGNNVLGYITILFSKKIFLNKINKFIFSLWIITVILLGITVFSIILISSSIVKSLSKTTNILKDIASGEGDLTKRINISSQDEIGILSKSFNTFVEKLQIMIRNVKENTQTLNNILKELPTIVTESSVAAGELKISATNAKLSIDKMNLSLDEIGTSAKSMSTLVTDVTTAIEELNISINDVAKNCHKEYSISENANTQSKIALETIDSLAKSSNDINRINDVIEGIADQINLLALNATIEAASAGDAGKGFAVVASEIKILAKQTASATNEIKDKIEAMQLSTNSSVNAIRSIATLNQEISSISQIIVSSVEEQSATTNQIADQIIQARNSALTIADGVGSSANEISLVASNMQHVDQVANKNEEGANKSQSAVNQLGTLSAKLQEIVDQFKI